MFRATYPAIQADGSGGWPAPRRQLAFLFRCIPVDERQFGEAGSASDSGVPFPLYSGRRTPVAPVRRGAPALPPDAYGAAVCNSALTTSKGGGRGA